MGVRLVIGLIGAALGFLAAYQTSWSIGAVALVVLCIAVIPRQVHRAPRQPADTARQLR